MILYGYLNESEEVDTLDAVQLEDIEQDDSLDMPFEENFMDIAANQVILAEKNWNSLMEASDIDELITVQENGHVMAITEAGRVAQFFEAAKEFFRNLWKKVQEIFKKAGMMFNSLIQDDKIFIKKYKKVIERAKMDRRLSEREIKYYNYKFYDKLTETATEGSKFEAISSIDAFITTIEGTVKGIKSVFSGAEEGDNKDKALKKLQGTEAKEDVYKAHRTSIVKRYNNSYSGEVTSKEFTKELREAIQGSDTPDDVKILDKLESCMKYLEASDKVRKWINDTLKYSNKSLQSAIKVCDDAKTAAEKVVEQGPGTNDADKEATYKSRSIEVSAYKEIITILKGIKQINVTANGIELQCLKSASKQAKRVCVAVVAGKQDKLDESTSIGEGTSVVSRVLFE